MLKSFLLLIVAAFSLTTPAFAEGEAPLLAPVDPLAWAVANADLGPYGTAQVEALRKVVNGQVTAHQVVGSYTDPVTRVVKRTKCSDPANCVMCSTKAREAGRELRAQISNSASAAQGSASMFALMSTYAEAKATALSEQARWNKLKNTNTIIETSNVDGQDVTTSKTVTVVNAADVEAEQTAALLKQLAASAQIQSQQQGQTVYSYITAAESTLEKPQPATELFVGEDPLR